MYNFQKRSTPASILTGFMESHVLLTSHGLWDLAMERGRLSFLLTEHVWQLS